MSTHKPVVLPAGIAALLQPKAATDKPAKAPTVKPAAAAPAAAGISLRGLGFTQKLADKTAADARRQEAELAAAVKAAREQTAATAATAATAPVAVNLAPAVAAVAAVTPPALLPTTNTAEGITLDPSQQRAVDELLNRRFGAIIGAAGTGKTTTVKALIAKLLTIMDNPTLVFCAFTGRAVQQLKRALPPEYRSFADTIHGVLEYAPEPEIRTDPVTGRDRVVRIFRPRRNQHNRLSQTVIIVDEGGMVPIFLWNQLMRALSDGARVYLLGDINQLPPVQGHSVLGYAMQAWPTFELNRIHRTNENEIIDGAHSILHGRMPKSGQRVQFVRCGDGATDANMTTQGVIQKLHKAGKFDPLQDAIIVPQNIETIGQIELNRSFKTYFNPPKPDETGVITNPRIIVTAGNDHHAYAVGDKVMVTKNNRDDGLTNGMIGVITEIRVNADFGGQIIASTTADHVGHQDIDLDALDEALGIMTIAGVDDASDDDDRDMQASHIITVHFQNQDLPHVFATTASVNSLQHAYAFTCHKAQGGEYRNVIIVLHSANSRMLSREWFYTAWTRATQAVIVVYNPRGLSQALSIQRIKGNTLAEKAQRFIALQENNHRSLKSKLSEEARECDGVSTTIPTLPESTVIHASKTFSESDHG